MHIICNDNFGDYKFLGEKGNKIMKIKIEDSSGNVFHSPMIFAPFIWSFL